MAETLSDQFDDIDAVPRVMLKPTDHGGRVRYARFSFESVTLAQNDTMKLCQLPNGARVVHGRIAYDALGTSTTLDIGIAGDTDKYLSALDVASAGQADFANTLALNMNDLLTADTDILALFEAANPSDNVTFEGYILYVID